MKPHLNRYWLNANPQNPQTFKQESNQICQLYQQAQELNSNNIHIVSTDEMTGIQALERAYPTDTMKPGKIEFQEFEYIRHETVSLIASWDVANGGICHSTVGATRNEDDFNRHIAAIIATKPSDGWIFVTDQLNFTSTLDLKYQILSFIDYFNRIFAKPFVWKFLGYPNAASTG